MGGSVRLSQPDIRNPIYNTQELREDNSRFVVCPPGGVGFARWCEICHVKWGPPGGVRYTRWSGVRQVVWSPLGGVGYARWWWGLPGRVGFAGWCEVRARELDIL